MIRTSKITVETWTPELLVITSRPHVSVVNLIHNIVFTQATATENHSGLGLSIVDDFRRKYPNIFIAQKYERDMFSVQIAIENHTGGK